MTQTKLLTIERSSYPSHDEIGCKSEVTIEVPQSVVFVEVQLLLLFDVPQF